jgi:hypothetical protein
LKQTYLNENDPVDKAEADKLRAANKESFISVKDSLLAQKLKQRLLGFALWVLQGAYDYCNAYKRQIPIPESLTKHVTKQVVESTIEPSVFIATNYTIEKEPLPRDDWIPIQELYSQYLNTDQGKPQHITHSQFSKKIAKYIQQTANCELLKTRAHLNGKYLHVIQNLKVNDTTTNSATQTSSSH